MRAIRNQQKRLSMAVHKINLISVGTVRNSITDTKHKDWQSVISQIVVKKDLEAALDGVDGFSHLIIIYWMHKLPPKQKPPTKVHPKGDQSLPLTGVFATRSPTRPNPIGMTVVKLLGHQRNTLEVMGLDAVNGTPVLDIKPYIPSHDSISEATSPAWLHSS